MPKLVATLSGFAVIWALYGYVLDQIVHIAAQLPK